MTHATRRRRATTRASSVRVPQALLADVRRVIQDLGVSESRFISEAIQEKLSAAEVEAYFRERGAWRFVADRRRPRTRSKTPQPT